MKEQKDRQPSEPIDKVNNINGENSLTFEQRKKLGLGLIHRFLGVLEKLRDK